VLKKDIFVQIDNFDGPLALLLHLVEKQAMPIKDLHVSEITKQYISYLSKMKQLNFDIAGDYLLMAAKLLYLKSEASFTDEKNDQLEFKLDGEHLDFESRDQLIKKLETLKRFQQLGQVLWEMPKIGHEVFIRPKINRQKYFQSVVKNMDASELNNTMIDLIRKQKKKIVVIKKDRLSIKNKIRYFQKIVESGKEYLLEDLIENKEILTDIVMSFISVLELSRLKKFSIFQNENYSPIYVQVIEALKDIDLDEVDEFGDEATEQDNTAVNEKSDEEGGSDEMPDISPTLTDNGPEVGELMQ
jgi:segregation and condensation protein A